MKALTVQQPWAWAIVHGGKDVENRTQVWKHRGPLAIHAGTRWSPRGGRSGLVWDALRDRFGWPVGPTAARDDDRSGFDAIRPLGAVIGVVDLMDVHLAEDGCCESPWAEREYVEHGGRVRRQITHLVLERSRPVAPVLARGALGLWEIDAALIEEVRS